jgi:hypothetical protein
MGKYGSAAVMAAKLYQEGSASSPNKAWELAVTNTFPSSKSSQAKGCPRGAFLGLCESGAVLGIPEGNYSRSQKNKTYALKALALIKAEPGLSLDEQVLWARVMEGEVKVPNHQMDVVSSLWNAGLVCG